MTLSKCVSLHLHLKLIWFLNSHHFIVKFSPDSLPVYNIYKADPDYNQDLREEEGGVVLLFSLSLCLSACFEPETTFQYKTENLGGATSNSLFALSPN